MKYGRGWLAGRSSEALANGLRSHAHLLSVAALIVAAAAPVARADVFFTKSSYDAANVTTSDVTFGGIVPAVGPPFIAVANPFAIGDLSITSWLDSNSVARSDLWGTPMDVFFPNRGTAWALFAFSAPQTAVGFSLSTVNPWTPTSPITAVVFNGDSMVASYTFQVSQANVFDGFFGLNNIGSITSVRITADTIYTEVSNISNAPLVGEVQSSAVPPNVPEPSTWAMMLIGFAGLGYAGYRTKTMVE